MASLAEIYEETPLNLKHIIPLDFKSVKGLPNSHVWEETFGFPELPFLGEGKSSIPVVDLMAPNVEELIGHACETWGIFRVVNHGIPWSHVEEAESQVRRLFALPTEVKMKALRSTRGTTGYGGPRIAGCCKKFMWQEGFTVAGSTANHAKELWPHDYRSFCDGIEGYQKKMEGLGQKLFSLMLKALKVSEEDFNWKPSMAECAMQINSYPTCPNPESAMGLAVHTDTMFLTILHQSTTKGMEIFRDGGWLSVPPVAGSFVVFVADLLHICSNGRFLSIPHRVLVNQEQHRYSIAFFYGASPDFQIAPFDKKSPIYCSATVKEILHTKAMNPVGVSHVRI